MRQAMITPEGEPAARNRTRAIVACTGPEIRQLLLSAVSEFRLQPVLSETLDDAKVLLTWDGTAMAFSQPRFSGGTFQEVLRAADGPGSRGPVIVCSEFYDKDLHIEAMSPGAFDYLAFPYGREEVAWIVNNAVNGSLQSPRTHAQDET